MTFQRNQKQKIKEWSARVDHNQSDIQGSFGVYIFFGPVPQDPAEWMADPNLVGVYDVFAPMDASEAHYPTSSGNSDNTAHGFVDLTYGLTEHLNREGQGALEAEVVVPFLTAQINWGVVTVRRLDTWLFC